MNSCASSAPTLVAGKFYSLLWSCLTASGANCAATANTCVSSLAAVLSGVSSHANIPVLPGERPVPLSGVSHDVPFVSSPSSSPGLQPWPVNPAPTQSTNLPPHLQPAGQPTDNLSVDTSLPPHLRPAVSTPDDYLSQGDCRAQLVNSPEPSSIPSPPLTPPPAAVGHASSCPQAELPHALSMPLQPVDRPVHALPHTMSMPNEPSFVPRSVPPVQQSAAPTYFGVLSLSNLSEAEVAAALAVLTVCGHDHLVAEDILLLRLG